MVYGFAHVPISALLTCQHCSTRHVRIGSVVVLKKFDPEAFIPALESCIPSFCPEASADSYTLEPALPTAHPTRITPYQVRPTTESIIILS